MSRYHFAGTDGHTLIVTGEIYGDDSVELFESAPALVTSFHPRNAATVLSTVAAGGRVSVCSDLLVEAAINRRDSTDLLLEVGRAHGIPVRRGGIRTLNQIDLIHFAMHQQWQEPGFRFNADYFQSLRQMGLADQHPLRAVFDFLDLDPVYALLALATYVDPFRFSVIGESYDQLLIDDYLGLGGPSGSVYGMLTRRPPMSSLNSPRRPVSLRRWLLFHGAWSSVTGSHRLMTLRNHLARPYRRLAGQARLVDIDMTRVVARYLLHHHRVTTLSTVGDSCDDLYRSADQLFCGCDLLSRLHRQEFPTQSEA